MRYVNRLKPRRIGVDRICRNLFLQIHEARRINMNVQERMAKTLQCCPMERTARRAETDPMQMLLRVPTSRVSKQRGFTLIEMGTVIVLIALFSMMVVP